MPGDHWQAPTPTVAFSRSRAGMTQPISLHWQASVPASCFRATAAAQRRPDAVDPELRAALAGPTEELLRALREDHIEEDVFWGHVIPLAARQRSMRELAEVTLTKI